MPAPSLPHSGSPMSASCETASSASLSSENGSFESASPAPAFAVRPVAPTLLIALADPTLARLVGDFLDAAGYRIVFAAQEEGRSRDVPDDGGAVPDGIVTDYTDSLGGGSRLVGRARCRNPRLKAVYLVPENAMAAEDWAAEIDLQGGKALSLRKPFTLHELLEVVALTAGFPADGEEEAPPAPPSIGFNYGSMNNIQLELYVPSRVSYP